MTQRPTFLQRTDERAEIVASIVFLLLATPAIGLALGALLAWAARP